MYLPGGFQDLSSGQSSKCAFADLNGSRELALWDVLSTSQTRPRKITKILDTVFDFEPAGRSATDLCHADRQFLLAQYAVQFGITDIWLSATCGDCKARFDVPVRLSDLPIKPRGDHYHDIYITIDGHKLACRIPTGEDMAIIASLSEDDAVLALAVCCLKDGLPEDAKIESLLPALDQALEVVAPEIPQTITAQCVDCEVEVELAFDVAKAVMETFENPLNDIHDIATQYHWSEAQILDLPRKRRLAYLDLIDAQNGGGH